MKRLLILFLLLVSVLVNATDLTNLTDTSSVYVEVEEIGDKEIEYAETDLYDILQSDEWGKWILADTKEDAEFILKVTLEKKGNWFSGVKVFLVGELFDSDSNLLWKSSKFKGNVTAFTGYNALGDVLRKFVRRGLKKELFEARRKSLKKQK
jgi:hypothetical protein